MPVVHETRLTLVGGENALYGESSVHITVPLRWRSIEKRRASSSREKQQRQGACNAEAEERVDRGLAEGSQDGQDGC